MQESTPSSAEADKAARDAITRNQIHAVMDMVKNHITSEGVGLDVARVN